MRRVVITGLGIVCSIGNNKQEVLESLRQGRSGIQFNQDYADFGFRSQIYGAIPLDLNSLINKRLKRFMGDAAAYSYLAMSEALTDAKLSDSDISSPRIGLITGSGIGSPANQELAQEIQRTKGVRKVGPFMTPRTMSSTTSACLATAFQIKGITYSVSAACATSAHCIGDAFEKIQIGKQDMIFAGGSEELHWLLTLTFDAMGALSSKYNNTPETASRPFDTSRDGFVISGGGGIIVLEELEHALARDAKIYAEVVGYGATSDGYDMVQPSGEGAVRCMQQALETVKEPVDYINAHATGTPVGDTRELEAIKQVFSDQIPSISSTKSLTGHALGATSVNEVIYSLLMMENHFISATPNITELDPIAENMPIVQELQENVTLNTIMSNSFGFGGTNATLVFQRFEK